MRPIAPHTFVVACAATFCALGALSPGLRAGLDPVEAAPVQQDELDRVAGEQPFGFEVDERGHVDVNLSDVFADPELFLGRSIRFTSQVAERPESWNPYLTRFGRARYGAVRVWGDEQRLWLPEEFENTRGLLFARRASRTWQRLAEVPVYGRVAIEGVVRQVFLDRPWIEVTTARVLPLAMTEGALIHASRGIALMKAGQYPFAVNEFARARASDLPLEIDAELFGFEERCRAVDAR